MKQNSASQTSRLVDFGLEGKGAIITGVSRSIGIGATVAKSLAKVGCNLFTTWYSPFDEMAYGKDSTNEAQDIIKICQAEGVLADGMQADLSDPLAPVKIFEAAEATIGPVNILINNAAYSVNADIYNLTAALMDAHYAVNLRGTVLMCTEYVRRYLGKTGGRIINMTSGQSIGPMPGEIPYITTKGAIEALTTSLSDTLIKQGITVNAVDPGATDTGWITPEIYPTLLEAFPAGRMGTPMDAAHLILFLASEQGGWITGQILHSRGGAR